MSAPQPDSRFVIEALQEELAAANQNRIYLMALLKHVRQEYQEAQEIWAMEKSSMIASRETTEP